ncbi:Hypothetical protein GbCGDNIH7_7107 [Granulibacter bethesdensis]|nr:Hypothetical protein GbCGDNIH7_7107 [Granulibacter bethesdensis]
MLVCSSVRYRLLSSGPASSDQQPDRKRHTGSLKKASALDGLQVMHFLTSIFVEFKFYWKKIVN